MVQESTAPQIERICSEQSLTGALNELIVEELPPKAMITQIREEVNRNKRTWIFKMVESREERRYVGETKVGELYQKSWSVTPVRAVNVARLHQDGLLEMSIHSHGGSGQYADDLSRFWEMLESFIPQSHFSDFSIANAKNHFWENRASLSGRVRFSDSTMRNECGTTLIASTGRGDDDLVHDSGASASIDEFLDHGAYCDSSNVWFGSPSGVINREVHVLLSSRGNEFAVPSNCTQAEYEYVLNELRTHNR